MSESEKPVDCVCGAIPRQMNLYPEDHLTDMFCVECACGLRGPFELCEEEATPAWNKMQRVLKNGPAAEEALRIIARNLRAGAVSTQWVNKYANDTVEALDPA